MAWNFILKVMPTITWAREWLAAKLVLRPSRNSPLESQITPIAGNTCLYGATGGRFFAAGTAGERFAVRNSGAIAVIEGCGDHGCEYMTGGAVLSLGANRRQLRRWNDGRNRFRA